MRARYGPPPNAPKQQHFVPRTYLEAFADEAGHLSVRDLWTGTLFRPRPINALKSKGLYNQPVHTERRYDASLEDFFNTVETRLPAMIRRLEARSTLDEPLTTALVEFLCMMRVRVPNTLKAVTQVLADLVKSDPIADNIAVPPALITSFKRARPDLDLWNNDAVSLADLIAAGLISVPIDPHRSLTAMPSLVLATAPIVARRGILQIAHNTSQTDFVTSDNPIVYFSELDGQVTPYPLAPQADFELLAPLTPRLAVWGSTRTQSRPEHREEDDDGRVEQFNNRIASFADRFIVSRQSQQLDHFDGHAAVCPVPDLAASSVLGTGEVLSIGYKWGPPIKNLPEFAYDDEDV